MSRIRDWFQTVWPNPQKRQAAASQYGAIGPLALADIALRGRVWRPSHVPNDPTTTAWNDGRRSLALEILELANMPPDRLKALIENRPERKRYDD